MNMIAATSYAEFGIQSNFSFLRGASAPEELVIAAKFLGLSAIGLADCNTVAGTVRAWKMAETEGLAYHPGCRLVFADGTPDILAYPQDRKGWGHLCRMLTQANTRLESEKGAPLLYRDDLFEWGDLLSLAVLPDVMAATETDVALLRSLRERFSTSLWLAVAPNFGGNDRFRIEQAAAMAAMTGLPLMATNDALYHAPSQRPLHDVLTAIRLNTPVTEAGFELKANAERHLKGPSDMSRLFRRHPEALAETLHFAESLNFSLKELKYNYPDEPMRIPGINRTGFRSKSGQHSNQLPDGFSVVTMPLGQQPWHEPPRYPRGEFHAVKEKADHATHTTDTSALCRRDKRTRDCGGARDRPKYGAR